MAGLSAGIYGSLGGYRCTILERHSRPGGNLTGWDRSGCHIDNCIHWLTGTAEGTELRQMWETLGALTPGIELCPTARLYGSEFEGKTVSLSQNLEETRENMLDIAPFDRAAVESFISAVRLAEKAQLPGRLGVGDSAAYAMAMAKFASMDLYGLSASFRHPLLRRVMTDYIGGEYVAAALVCAYGAYACGNGGIPKGGSAAMAERMAERFRSLGGKLVTGAEVSEIRLENTRAAGVVLRSGEFIPGDYVICASDPEVTFGQLLGRKYTPAYLKKCYANGEKYPIFSSVQCAFEADTMPTTLKNTTVFDTVPFRVGSESVGRLAVREYSHDSCFAPEGKTVIQSMIFQREWDCAEWISKKKNSEEYAEGKARVGELVGRSIENHSPELKGRLKLLDVWTPATYAEYFGANRGAFMSFAMTRGARRKKLPAQIRGLENVLLATQWQQMPGGLPTAAMAGKAAAEKVCALEKPRKNLSRAAAMVW